MGTWNPGPGATNGADVFTGDGTGETVNGLGGDDSLSPGEGADTVNGGDGSDYISVADSYRDVVNGGAGYDIIQSDWRDDVDGGADGAAVQVIRIIDAEFDVNLADWYIDGVVYLPLGGAIRNASVITFTFGFGGTFTGSDYSDSIIADTNRAVEMHGGDGDDYLTGSRASSALYGDGGSDRLSSINDGLDATPVADLFDGGEGDDYISAGIGDHVIGGAGKDEARLTFITDFEDATPLTLDMSVIDAGGNGVVEGITLESVELIQTGTYGGVFTYIGFAGEDVAFGGVKDDSIQGMDGGDTIDGFLGDDILSGGEGNDYISGDDGCDDINGDEGDDEIYAGDDADIVVGGDGVDKLYGDAGDDRLSGGDEGDELRGGDGADFIEGGKGADDIDGGAGVDTVSYAASLAGVSVALGGLGGSGGDAQSDFLINIENLTGSAFNDTLTGNSGANILDGGLGADIMRGGAGDDTMYVNSASDVAEDILNGGLDIVIASRSWAVASNIERVYLVGAGDFNVAGNGLANVLRGNAADNWLNGSFGKDTLTGGKGRDSFIFNRTLGPNNVDVITDFDAPRDVIRVDDAVFTGIGGPGALGVNKFFAGAAAHDADDRIVYDQAKGWLYFDADGNGAGAAIHFATLSTRPAGVTAADFIII